jgi:hypothetical protein
MNACCGRAWRSASNLGAGQLESDVGMVAGGSRRSCSRHHRVHFGSSVALDLLSDGYKTRHSAHSVHVLYSAYCLECCDAISAVVLPPPFLILAQFFLACTWETPRFLHRSWGMDKLCRVHGRNLILERGGGPRSRILYRHRPLHGCARGDATSCTSWTSRASWKQTSEARPTSEGRLQPAPYSTVRAWSALPCQSGGVKFEFQFQFENTASTMSMWLSPYLRHWGNRIP